MPVEVVDMKLVSDRCLDAPILMGALVCLVLLSPWQLASSQTVPAKVSFDGRYVQDTSRNSGEILAGTSVPPCPKTASNTVGQGLIVDNSIATFLVGVQEIGALKIK